MLIGITAPAAQRMLNAIHALPIAVPLSSSGDVLCRNAGGTDLSFEHRVHVGARGDDAH
jgi:hypothetical protein